MKPDKYDERSMSFEEIVKNMPYRFLFCLERIHERFPKEKISVLDAGCGPGVFLKKCIDEGYKAQGVDTDKKARSLCAANTKTVVFKDIENVKGKYDVVTAISVVEHVEHYKKFVKQMWSRVKNGGLFLIIVPIENKLDSPDHKHWFNFYDVLGFAEVLSPKAKDYHIYMINKFVKNWSTVNEFALVIFKNQ